MREKRAGFLMLCVHDFDLRGCFRIVRMIVIVYGQGARSVHIDNAIVTVVVTNVMPLQNREVMQGVGYPRTIHTVGDVVGR